MTNLTIAFLIALVIVVKIIIVRVVKRRFDDRCKESYEQGVIDSTKGYKIELEDSMKKAFRTGIEQGKKHIIIEMELASNVIYRKIKGE